MASSTLPGSMLAPLRQGGRAEPHRPSAGTSGTGMGTGMRTGHLERLRGMQPASGAQVCEGEAGSQRKALSKCLLCPLYLIPSLFT